MYGASAEELGYLLDALDELLAQKKISGHAGNFNLVESHNEQISLLPGGIQVSNMPGVQDVEATVCKNNPLTFISQPFERFFQLAELFEFILHLSCSLQVCF